MEGKNVLLVEDDPNIAALVALHLKDLGLNPVMAPDGNIGMELASQGSYALIILDMMLPGASGIEVLKHIREKNREVPILVLTLKSELADKVLTLELGADDYLTKPFAVAELLARVRALLRRVEVLSPAGKQIDSIELGDLNIDIKRHEVTRAGAKIELTAKQFDLLLYLAQQPGRVVPRAELLKAIWNYELAGYEHSLDSQINRLRSQLEIEPSRPRYVLTVRGVGYRFAEPAELAEQRSGSDEKKR